MTSTHGDQPSSKTAWFLWLIALATLAMGMQSSGILVNQLDRNGIAVTLALHAIPLLALLLPFQIIRVYGCWFGLFLIIQALLSPLMSGDNRYYLTLPPHMDHRIDVVGDALPGIQGPQTITTDAMGFRAHPPVDYQRKRGLRLFAIGGSTTEQIYLDDEATWTYLLQERLKAETERPVEVVNTGLSGIRARHHLATFRRILAHEPDCALFLVGVNDWNKHIRETFGTEGYRPTGAPFRQTLFGRALKAVHRLASPGEDDGAAGEVQIEDGSYYSQRNNSLARPDRRNLAIDDVSPGYRAEIEAIGEACHDSGVSCVFLTQPHGYSTAADPAYRRYFWMTPPEESYTLDIASMAAIADVYNRHLARFAKEQGHGLIDLAAALPSGTEVFYDDVHFNAAGARRVTEVIAEGLSSTSCGALGHAGAHVSGQAGST
jgi:lysophospholipase L1-like esterase